MMKRHIMCAAAQRMQPDSRRAGRSAFATEVTSRARLHVALHVLRQRRRLPSLWLGVCIVVARHFVSAPTSAGCQAVYHRYRRRLRLGWRCNGDLHDGRGNAAQQRRDATKRRVERAVKTTAFNTACQQRVSSRATERAVRLVKVLHCVSVEHMHA